jgi:N-acetylglucosamine-6-phosphate deacetylase
MSESNRCIFSGMQILLEQKWVKDYAVIIEDRIIKNIIPAEMIKHHLPARRYEYDKDSYLIPGLIDIHIHGAKGYDVMDGKKEALLAIKRALAGEGVTGFLATTLTASDEKIENALKAVAETLSDNTGAAILGVHLEGPFIAKDKMGAQHPEYIKEPDEKLVQHWQTVANGAIKLLTLAPELPRAIPFIHTLTKMGIRISAGHTNANYEETIAAIAAGCTQATHLFNAMRGIKQRDPGATGALLLSNAVTAELIVDGLHLHPAIVRLAFQLKSKQRLVLVTDAIRAKCLANGRYELGEQEVLVSGKKVCLEDGTLAGSVLTMPEALSNMMEFTKCSLSDAVEMASFNPAHLLGLSQQKGSIAVGKDADLVVLDANLDVLLTVCEGRKVFER